MDEGKKKGLAGLIIALGSSKKDGMVKVEKKGSMKGAAIDDIFDALKADDKEAFRDAVMSYSEMCKGEEYEEEEE